MTPCEIRWEKDATTGIFTFFPTWRQLRKLSFTQCILQIETLNDAVQLGAVRVRMPIGYRPRQKLYNPKQIAKELKIKSFRQEFYSHGNGCFEIHYEPTRLSFEEFYKMATNDPKHQCLAVDPLEIENAYNGIGTFQGELAPLYAADQIGSLFDSNFAYWNPNNLDTVLDCLKDRKLKGIVSPMLYVGMWAATFAWHVEDMDLYSMNHLHAGSSKYWYVVPPAQREAFERLAAKIFPHAAAGCPEFLRHKMYWMPRQLIEKNGIRVSFIEQNPGDFIVLWPEAYHAGFNAGYNIAEAINFAMPSWTQIGCNATYCKCEQDTVRIDMEEYQRLAKKWTEKKEKEKNQIANLPPPILLD